MAERDTAGVGVDRLSVAFRVAARSVEGGEWDEVTTKRDGRSIMSTRVEGPGGVPVFVGAAEVDVKTAHGPERRWYGKVELNPSRWVDPEGFSLCAPELVEDIAREALELASGRVLAVEEPGEARVKRLDVARDFAGVERPEFYLRGLVGIRRPWAKRQFVYHDPTRNRAETLTVGSGAGIVRLYDKHQETKGKAPKGTLRWEAEARSGWLERYANIERVRELRGEQIRALASDRWRWSSMGAEVAATGRVVEKVMRSGLTPAAQRAFLGYLVLRAYDASAITAERSAQRYDKLARELGIALDASTLEGSAPEFVGKLDYRSGREVLRVA